MNRLRVNILLSVFLLCSTCWSLPSHEEFLRAALNGETEIIRDGLREKGAEYAHIRDRNQNTPLHFAAHAKKGKSSAPIIALLLKYGADVNAINYDYSTPLQIAALTNNLAGAKVLLKEPSILPPDPSFSSSTPLLLSIGNRSLEMLTLLLSHPKIDPNQKGSEGMTPLHLAAKEGHSEGVKLLLNNSQIDPNPKQIGGDFPGATPLHYAAMQAHPIIISLLLEQKGVDVNQTITEGLYEGFTPVHFSVMNHDTPLVFESLKLLYRAGANLKPRAKNKKYPENLTNIRVILQFLQNPDPSLKLRKKR